MNGNYNDYKDIYILWWYDITTIIVIIKSFILNWIWFFTFYRNTFSPLSPHHSFPISMKPSYKVRPGCPREKTSFGRLTIYTTISWNIFQKFLKKIYLNKPSEFSHLISFALLKDHSAHHFFSTITILPNIQNSAHHFQNSAHHFQNSAHHHHHPDTFAAATCWRISYSPSSSASCCCATPSSCSGPAPRRRCAVPPRPKRSSPPSPGGVPRWGGRDGKGKPWENHGKAWFERSGLMRFWCFFSFLFLHVLYIFLARMLLLMFFLANVCVFFLARMLLWMGWGSYLGLL